ncbi:MAG: ABC transporter permease [Vicinamibacterales bacterium]
MVSGFLYDLRYALRVLRREQRHTILTIVTMALGIGVTTALFSVTYGVLLKPFSWPNGDQIVELRETRGGSAPRFGAMSNTAYVAWQDGAETIDQIAAWSMRVVTLTGSTEPERIRIVSATASLFPTLGARPLIGSYFEERDESTRVIVLFERMWRERFGAEPSVLGRTVHLDGEPFTVVGVLSDRFAYPDRRARAIVPFRVPPPTGNSLSMFSAIASLRPGVTAAQAAAEGTARARLAADTGMTTMAIFGNNGPIEIVAQPLRDALTAGVRRPLVILLAAVVLLLLTATANVASLQLARAATRSREMAIRAALGAGSARVTRQLVVENLLVGAAGGALGLTLAWWLQRSMPALLPADFPRMDALGIDASVVAFSAAVTVGTSVLFGLIPAWRVRRLNMTDALAEDGSAPVGAGVRTRTARARMMIMTAQVAIACVLVVGASLLGRSFLALLNADRGFDPTDVLSALMVMPQPLYPQPERRFAIVSHVLSRLDRAPGIADAAFTSEMPLTMGGSSSAFTLKSPLGDGGMLRVQASPRIVSPHYFSVLGIRILAGRGFSDADTETSQPVVIVNQTFARQYLGSSPLGSKLPLVAYGPSDADPVESTVIGVVDDVRYVTSGERLQPEIYYSFRQMGYRLPVQTITLLARATADTDTAAASIRSAVRDADQQLVADLVVPLEQRLLSTLARPRLYAVLLGGFAACAIVIAAVGLVGVLSYSVSQRARELAIRSALGATRRGLLLLILRQGLAVTLSGLVAGLLASVWLTALLSTQLYGVQPHDPLSFFATAGLLLLVGVLASLMPARRAARIDPLRVLRQG